MSVNWTDEEVDSLIEAILTEHGYGKWPFANYTMFKRIQQKVLLKARWRSMNSHLTTQGRIDLRVEQWREAGAKPTAPFINLRTFNQNAKGKTPKSKANKTVASLPRPPAAAPFSVATSAAPGPAPAVATGPVSPARWRPGPTPAAPPASAPAAPTRAAVPPAPQAPTPGPLPWGAQWPRPEQISDVLSTFLAGVLVDSIKKALVNHEVAGIINTLRAGGLPSAVVLDPALVSKHNPAPGSDAAPKEDKMTVLVCGMRSHQQGTLQSRFPKMHMKFFYTSEKGGAGLEQLRSKVREADVVLYKMDESSHAHVELAKNAGKKVIRVTGSIDAMINALQTLEVAQP